MAGPTARIVVPCSRRRPTVLRTDIEGALKELISNEEGMKFQGLAVVLAKQKWPRLVACERKWDLGLDAHASGELEPDRRGVGLACSLMATVGKISGDATKVRKNYPDVAILIFATAEKVTQHAKNIWAEQVKKDFAYDLVVVSREEIVTSLMDPSNAAICSGQLGIPVELKPELKLVLGRAREAAGEVIASWEQRPRLAGRPQIDLDAERVDEGRETRESLTVESLRKLLAEGRRIILEAPAGRGKTTTLVQLAKRTIDAGGLGFLVDLPAWAKSGMEILQFVEQKPQFVSRGLDANALSSLRGSEPFSFLLNGWNEISEGTGEAAVQALRDLELNYPAAGIIVATRTHHIRPPLPGAFRAKLLKLSRSQRNDYLHQVLGAQAEELRIKLDNSRVLDELTRTPLILAEVTDLFRDGNAIPTTKMGILGAVMHVIEASEEHHAFLQQAPLGGYAAEYLRALSMGMTERGEVEIAEADARASVNSLSAMLQRAEQIVALPEPKDVLHELSNHHVLERLDYPGTTFRFQHQQFQEFFAALGLKSLLFDLVRDRDASVDMKFVKRYVNEPRWGESLRMLAEEISSGRECARFAKSDGGSRREAREDGPQGRSDFFCGAFPRVRFRRVVRSAERSWGAAPGVVCAGRRKSSAVRLGGDARDRFRRFPGHPCAATDGRQQPNAFRRVSRGGRILALKFGPELAQRGSRLAGGCSSRLRCAASA